MKTDKHKSDLCSFKDCAEKTLGAVTCPYSRRIFAIIRVWETGNPKVSDCFHLESCKRHYWLQDRRKSKYRIEGATSLVSLKNDNDKLTAMKLRLCHSTSGKDLSLDHTLETWITKKDCPLYNGRIIIIIIIIIIFLIQGFELRASHLLGKYSTV
jgi:hypothetical protein